MAGPNDNASLAAYLSTRRTVPSLNLGGPKPDEDVVSKILEIAVRVPDHGKLAPWRFIRYPAENCVDIGRYLSDLWGRENSDASLERLALEKTRFMRAPMVIGVVSNPITPHKVPVWEQQLSSGAVCLNLIHAANAYGFAAQWLTEWYSYHDEAMRYLGVQEGERLSGFIHIGTPKVEPSERTRPTVDTITSVWAPELK
ncbi:MAG: nitroreductase [Hyphomicrobiales bacterium]